MFLSFASNLNGIMGTDTNTADLMKQESMMQMLGNFTVLRMVGLMGAANVTITKEQLLELNAKLNQVKK